MKKKILTYLGIGLLGIGAIFLGNYAGNRFFNEDNAEESNMERSPEMQAGHQGAQLGESATLTIAGEEIRAPGSDSTEEERAAFSEKIAELGVETDEIGVDDACNITPPVSLVNLEAPITLTNSGNETHTVRIFDQDFEVSPGGQIEIAFDFLDRQMGIYGLACDTSGTKAFIQLGS